MRHDGGVGIDKEEARQVAERILDGYRGKSYPVLVESLLGAQEVFEVVSPTGCTYQVEVEAFWDGGRRSKGGDLRVMVSIDDGGLSAFRPFCTDFILSPDGSFVGE